LKDLASRWSDADNGIGRLDCRHFFSGAAAYRRGSIVASLTPVGLAFKVSTDVRVELLSSGRASPLRYFPDAPVKRDYVLFASASDVMPEDAARLILGVHRAPG
jgi:TfoX/Sxy family transcriptional regulator of competence genes